MVLGSSLKEWSTNEFHPGLVPEGPIVQVNVDSAVIARAFPVEDGIVADAGAVIDQLIQLGDATPPGQSCDGRREAIAELKRQASPWHEREKRESTSVPLKPQRLMADVQEVLDEPRRIGRHGANVVLDIGNNAGWAWHHLTIDPPNRIWSNTGFGCVGWGNGAVVGAKLAAPEQTAICITGDGGFLMNGAEVTTAVQHGIGCVWLVLRDNSWSQVSQAFSRDFDEPDNIDWASYFALGGTPIEQMAEGFGARVHVVRKPREAIEVLSSAIAAAGAGSRSVPQVVVAHIDPAELPPFGLQKLSDVLVDEGLARVAGAPASATRPEIPGWYPERRR